MGLLAAVVASVRDWYLPLAVCALVGALVVVTVNQFRSGEFPSINDKQPFEYSDARVKQNYSKHAHELLLEGLNKYPGKPFRMIADYGYVLIFPPEYAQELRNIEALSHVTAIAQIVNAHYPGMEAFHEFAFGKNIIHDAIKLKLTQALDKITKPLSDETSATLLTYFTDSKEWHSFIPHDVILEAVARVSSRLFLGDKLCRDPEWLSITTSYTGHLAATVRELNYWPKLIRRIVAPYLPRARIMQKEVSKAKRLIGGVIKERQALKAQGKSPEYLDAIEWFDQIAKGRKYNPVYTQLSLSFLAIHTTADMVTQLMFDLAENPEVIPLLRNEVIEVLGKHGWKKSSLYNLKLLDSTMKETQRIRPISEVSIQRRAEKDVTLADGTFIKEGTILAVASTRHWDDEIYPQARKFEADRFLKLRSDPAKENTSQFVSTSPDHLGFGHGQHACPGRFFASNEVKIVMCHILLKYEWRLVNGQHPKTGVHGFILTCDHATKLEIRSRQPELDLDALE